MPFDIVKRKNRPITGRQLSDSLIERYAVNYGHGIGVFSPFHYLRRRFAVFSRLLHAHATFAKMHEHLIDGEPVQPGSKSGFTPETTDFSKELDEDLLCEIFGLRDIAGHSQAERVDAAIMTLVKLFESSHIALGRFLRQLVICRLRCLGFGCGHVFICSGKFERYLTNFRHVWHDSHASACFKGAALFSLPCPRGDAVQRSSTLNAAVMRRFARVVALPDSKSSDFASRINSFRTAGLQDTA